MWLDKNLSDLDGCCEGSTLFIVGSGPSLDDFPVDRLKYSYTIALNGAIEAIPHTSLWLFGDGKFARWGAKKFLDCDFGAAVINERHRGFVDRYVPRGYDRRRYQFTNENQEASNHLPGRWTIATIALSLAERMRPRNVILLGVDMGAPGGDYYSSRVRSKVPSKQDSMMGQWRKWIQSGFKRGLWTVPVETPSPYFHEFCPGTPVKKVSIEECIL